MNGSKIRLIRELRGFSQENIAHKLGITQASYSRIENNQTRLDTFMLDRLAKEFGVTPMDILSHEPTIVNFSSGRGTNSQDGTDNSYAFQKDLVEKIMLSKDSEINTLKEIIAGLIKEKEILLKLLQSAGAKNSKS